MRCRTWPFQWTDSWTPKIQDGGNSPSWKSTLRDFSAVGGPIGIKCRRRVQNDMPTAAIWSKTKLEVKFQYGRQWKYSFISAADWVITTKYGLEFQYGGRLFFQTGSSYVSCVDTDMSINVDLQKFSESDIMKYKPEIVWSCRGRHFVIVYDVITPPQVVRFGRNLATWFRIARRLLRPGQNRK